MRGFQGRRNRGYTRNMTPGIRLNPSEAKEMQDAVKKAVEETAEEISKLNALRQAARNNGINLGGAQE